MYWPGQSYGAVMAHEEQKQLPPILGGREGAQGDITGKKKVQHKNTYGTKQAFDFHLNMFKWVEILEIL